MSPDMPPAGPDYADRQRMGVQIKLLSIAVCINAKHLLDNLAFLQHINSKDDFSPLAQQPNFNERIIFATVQKIHTGQLPGQISQAHEIMKKKFINLTF